jgi:ankyrin repeat protein
LLQLAAFQDRLRRAAQVLLAAGADPNQRIGNRYPPGSVTQPDDGQPLSALYGAAGLNHDPWLTKLLLDAGADPNDGESLYHSLENPDCTRLLLQRGARVTGSNALYRAMDLRDPAPLELLLAHGGDANEPARNPPLTEWGSPLLWAIRRRRSRPHIEALLAAGADPAVKTPAGVSAYSLAMQFGLPEVATLLQAEGLSDEDAFVAACARGDETAARRIQAARPDLPAALPERQLRLLPDFVAEGSDAAAMLMVRLGWPVAVRGGDWSASALNLAVFRGDPGLTEFLLSHGSSWREEQGYGDNVCGTLAWASFNEPVEGGDWLGCARALLAHGMPGAEPDPADPEIVLVEGRRYRFSEDVTEFMLSAR